MPEQLDDIIVLIPGITGSVLTKDGKTVWAPQAGAAMRAFFSGADSIRALTMEGEDHALDDLGDGVVATGLVQDLHLIPGISRIDGYTAFRTALLARLALKQGENYFEFAYDWRRDNRVAARKLKRAVEGWLAQRRKTRPDAKAVLVAHSMGGIISRIYCDMLGGWPDVRRLVTFGTPFSGSLNALDSIANGFFVGKWKLRYDLSDTLRSFPSVYQLLASYRCFKHPESGEWVPLDEVPGIPNLDYARLGEALGLHRAIRAAVDDNRTDNYDGTGGYDKRPLVGDWQPTKVSARFDGGEVVFSQFRGAGETGGDGTVPTLSAIPHEDLASRANVFFIDEKHGSLQNHPTAADNLASLLRMVTGELVFPAPEALLSLEAGDAALGEPINVKARASVEGVELDCRVENIGTGEVVRLPMVRDPDDPRAANLVLDLPAEGDYRLKVGGPGVHTVTELVSVVNVNG